MKIKYAASIEIQICGSLSHVLGNYSLTDKRINQPEKNGEKKTDVRTGSKSTTLLSDSWT
jgi:hypothetical protein